MDKQQIRDAYELYWLENGTRPISVFTFCKKLDLPESDFYNQYSSFEAIEKDIWLNYFNKTLDQIQNDETYKQYTVREKLLTFYFVWVQTLKEHRSYILLHKKSLLNYGVMQPKPDVLDNFRKAFYEYVRNLIKEGYSTHEIKERKYISDKYVHGFWVQALFVLRYWLTDTSDKFEMTDAAIEKAVNLSFKLIIENTLDSLVDFGKFLFTKK
jgi:hypothetical protein